MYFANPWGLIGLLALPAILAIHLYHRRLPMLEVAGLHLWFMKQEPSTAGRRREKLPLTPSLFLELLAALLLSLALSDPRIGDLDQLRHLTVVLDNSASMSAKIEGETTLRDAALEELETRMKGLGSRGRITIILTGRRPELLVGPAATWGEAQQALENWVPSLPRHSFLNGWDFALQVAGTDRAVLFLTDHIPEEEVPPSNMEIVSLGRAIDNLAFTTGRWTYSADQGEGNVFLRLANFSREKAEVDLTGTAKSQRIFEKKISLEPGGGVSLEIPVPGGLGELIVQATAQSDALDLDSRITLIEPKARVVHLHINSLPPDLLPIMEKGLSVIPDIEIVAEQDKMEFQFGSAQTFPPSNPSLWWLGFGPIDPNSKSSVDLPGPFVIDRNHFALEGITLNGVVFTGVQPIQLATNPLVTMDEYMLFGELKGTKTTAFLCNLDLLKSNLSETPDWPILLLNLVENRRKMLPGLPTTNFRVGESIEFRLFEGEDPDRELPLMLKSSDKVRPLVRSSIVELPIIDQIGVYELVQGDKTWDRFAINLLDEAESDLTQLRPGKIVPELDILNETLGMDSYISWVLFTGTLLSILVLLMNWFVVSGNRLRSRL